MSEPVPTADLVAIWNGWRASARAASGASGPRAATLE
jgi:hypothetical protein